jgi:hypothetical protein
MNGKKNVSNNLIRILNGRFEQKCCMARLKEGFSTLSNDKIG